MVIFGILVVFPDLGVGGIDMKLWSFLFLRGTGVFSGGLDYELLIASFGNLEIANSPLSFLLFLSKWLLLLFRPSSLASKTGILLYYKMFFFTSYSGLKLGILLSYIRFFLGVVCTFYRLPLVLENYLLLF